MRHVVMAPRTLHFYFDYLSPYAYLAWQEMPSVAEKHDLEVRPAPVLLAGLLDRHGHKGPAEIPPKRAYMFKDCLRRAAGLGVPFRPPFSLPFRPLVPLRASLLDMDPKQRIALVTRLFDATWGHSRDVSDPRVVGPLCEEVGVQNAVQRIEDPEVKLRLRRATTDAIEEGVFGVPTMRIGDELFWGTDSIPLLVAHLRGEDSAASWDPAEWAAIKASAARRGSQ